MSSPKNTVQINDRRYDASTGKLLAGGSNPGAAKPNRIISDMVGAKNAPAQAIQPTSSKPRVYKRPPATSAIRKKTQRSGTLMRPAVKKPALKGKTRTAQEPPKLAPPVNKDRLQRAKTVPKSDRVKRFNLSAVSRARAIQPKAERLEVKAQAPAHPPVKQPSKEWPIIDQFEKAMQEASSHLETFTENTVRKKNRKWAYAVVSLAALLVIGFGAYQAIPIAKVKLAGNKAGFSPSLPSYSPSGFGLADPVQADYGKVTLSYKSRTDDKGFKLTQAPSQWNSQSLISNFLSSHQDYQTVRGSGQTIFTYSDSDATWVDSGIWYRIEGNAKLSDDQLLKLANSL